MLGLARSLVVLIELAYSVNAIGAGTGPKITIEDVSVVGLGPIDQNVVVLPVPAALRSVHPPATTLVQAGAAVPEGALH